MFHRMDIRVKTANDIKVDEEKVEKAIKTPLWDFDKRNMVLPGNISGHLLDGDSEAGHGKLVMNFDGY